MMFVLLAVPALAQDLRLPAASPRASVSQTVGVVEITVDWSSPGKKDRTIWGELVPYDTLWRTGANAATTLETTGDVEIGGQDLPAGKYAIFTIPGRTEWTVIVNKNPNQANTGDYDQKLDAARFTVTPVEAPARERMTFLFSDSDDDSTSLDLEWAGLRVSLPITVDTGAMVASSIDAWTDDAASTLANAARYEAEHGDLPSALELVDASMAIDQTWFNTFVKADILHQQEQHKQAYALAQKALELGNAAGDEFFFKPRVEKALAEWKKK